jgi:hypothetical protein
MQGRLRVAILTPRIEPERKSSPAAILKPPNNGYFSDQAQFFSLAIVVLLSGRR